MMHWKKLYPTWFQGSIKDSELLPGSGSIPEGTQHCTSVYNSGAKNLPEFLIAD